MVVYFLFFQYCSITTIWCTKESLSPTLFIQPVKRLDVIYFLRKINNPNISFWLRCNKRGISSIQGFARLFLCSCWEGRIQRGVLWSVSVHRKSHHIHSLEYARYSLTIILKIKFLGASPFTISIYGTSTQHLRLVIVNILWRTWRAFSRRQVDWLSLNFIESLEELIRPWEHKQAGFVR